MTETSMAALPGEVLSCASELISYKRLADLIGFEPDGNIVDADTAGGHICAAKAGEKWLAVGPSGSDTGLMRRLTDMAASCIAAEYDRRQREAHQKAFVRDYITSIRSRQLLGVDGLKPYPYDTEKKLISAITAGDAMEARARLNEILGFIFYTETKDIQSIRVRAIELTVLISRAALDAGAEECGIWALCPKFISDVIGMDDFDEICLSLSDMLSRFMSLTFSKPEVRHRSIIARAVKYVSDNYMHRITLDDTAAIVFVSPSYLSRLFISEMGMSFTEYVSRLRISKSCLLLRGSMMSISEVSSLCGFSDQSYYNKVFRKVMGVSPKQYRDMG